MSTNNTTTTETLPSAFDAPKPRLREISELDAPRSAPGCVWGLNFSTRAWSN